MLACFVVKTGGNTEAFVAKSKTGGNTEAFVAKSKLSQVISPIKETHHNVLEYVYIMSHGQDTCFY